MIILELVRGLGNQMFQYAFSLELENCGKEVLFSKDYTDEEIIKYGDNVIFDVYGIEEHSISREEFRRMRHETKGSSSDYIRIDGKGIKYISENARGKFDHVFLEYDDVFLDGYWQSEKYFASVRDKVCDAFRPKLSFNENCLRMIERMEKDEGAVSVHLRLGDYNTEDNKRIFGGICTNEYYEKSFAYIRERVSNPTFYVFSNDLENAEEFFKGFNYVLVDCNELSDGWADMYLMSLCKHNIVANSSFSWWGAYLNRNPQKIVVAPPKWINTWEMPDICPPKWIRMQ